MEPTSDIEQGLLSGQAHGGRLQNAWSRPISRVTAAPWWLKHRIVLLEEEEEVLQQLRHVASVPYDNTEPVHEKALRRCFFRITGQELEIIKDPRWKTLGFQAEDPRTDFRGGGFLALQNLCLLADAHEQQLAHMLREARGESGQAEYLFAAATINISAMLVLLLGLNASPSMCPVPSMPCPGNAVLRKNFASAVLAQATRSPTETLGELFARAVMKLHSEWTLVCARKPAANLLDFGEALQATSQTLEALLSSPLPKDVALEDLFKDLESIDPGCWTTRIRIRWTRFYASFLQAACRCSALIAAVLASCVPCIQI